MRGVAAHFKENSRLNIRRHSLTTSFLAKRIASKENQESFRKWKKIGGLINLGRIIIGKDNLKNQLTVFY